MFIYKRTCRWKFFLATKRIITFVFCCPLCTLQIFFSVLSHPPTNYRENKFWNRITSFQIQLFFICRVNLILSFFFVFILLAKQSVVVKTWQMLIKRYPEGRRTTDPLALSAQIWVSSARSSRKGKSNCKFSSRRLFFHAFCCLSATQNERSWHLKKKSEDKVWPSGTRPNCGLRQHSKAHWRLLSCLACCSSLVFRKSRFLSFCLRYPGWHF